MSKQEKEAAELKKELEERKAELAMLAKKNQIKAKAKAKAKVKAKATKVEKPKPKAKVKPKVFFS